jgi:hypothetical protein
MHITLIVTLVLHVLSGVFWAGTTFALAGTGAHDVDRLFRPQQGAAALAVVTGGLLWFLLHRGPLGMAEQILAVGVLCALAAGAVQGALSGPALRKLASASDADTARLRGRLATAQRVAAGLLILTVVCMAAARYV